MRTTLVIFLGNRDPHRILIRGDATSTAARGEWLCSESLGYYGPMELATAHGGAADALRPPMARRGADARAVAARCRVPAAWQAGAGPRRRRSASRGASPARSPVPRAC